MRYRLPALLALLSLEACGPSTNSTDAGIDAQVDGAAADATDAVADAVVDAARGSGAILGRVRAVGAIDGLAGVTVRRAGGSDVVTDAHGFFVFSAVSEDPRATVIVDHPGYAPAIEPVAVEAGAVSEVDVVLVRYTASAQIDPRVGGRVDDGAGGVALIPANALVTADGLPATGMVTVSIAPIDPSDSAQMAAFPGDFTALRSDGSATDLETFVPMVVTARQGTATLELAAGMSAELSLPVPAGATARAPESIEFWRLDPATGQWREAGAAQRTTAPSLPGRVIYRAPVQRMGWWNADRPTQTTCVRGCVRAPDGRPFPRARVSGRGVDYYGTSGAVTSPSTGCFAMDVKRASRVAISASSGGLSSPSREVMSGDAVMRAASAGERCQDLGVIELAAPVPDPCATGRSLCGDTCVDLGRDTRNCGACGAACAAGFSCVAGACACGAEQTRCGDRCVDTRTDVDHCGACGNACGLGGRCASGACVVMDAGVDVPRDTGVDVPRDTGVDVPRDTGVDVPRDTGVDVPRDTGVDTGPTCPAGLTYCGSDCVDLTSSESNCGACANACAGGTNGVPACTARVCGLQCFAGYDDCDGNRANGCETVLLSTAAHCGACGRACTAPTGGDASCMMGSCRMSCPAGRTLCGSACVDTRADASHCGVCGSACAAGRSCVNGACTVPETPFRVVALPVAECRLNEHSALSGSSQGGLAYTREQLIHAGSTGTAVFDPNLLRGTLGPTRYPALIGTTTGQAYTLAAGSAPLGATGGVADGIIAVNPDGALSPTRVALSTPITITTGTGFFSGYNRVMVHAGGRVWDIDVTTGQVSNRGAVTLPPHPTCGGLGFWGVAENYVGQHYLVFIQNRTTIARVRVSDGQVTPLATFTDLGSSCAFTVGQGQWFIATDGPSDFAPAANVGASHVVGCTANTDQPIVVGGASLAAGGGFSCALRPNGGVACWGVNADGQVGDNNAASPRLAPSAVVAMPTAVSVVAGARHACALQSAGRVYCWGDNASGQLGSNTVTGRRFAALVGGLSDAVEIAAGDAHTCARRSNGAVMCWGANAQGQIGDGSTINRLAPVAVADVTDAIGITAGAAHTCVLRRNLTALCWGANAQGQIGDGSAINRPGATPVTGLFELRSLAAGGEFTCARGGENALCWGANASGQLGDGSRTGRLVPREIDLPASGQIAAGGSHACAVTRTRTAGCWGNGASGRLGNGDTLDRVNPTDVRGLANVTEITLGEDHTCARVEGGAVLCWGANLTGQLGDGTSASRLTPVAVTGL